jgi:CBS domain containing-hemolysin-like protein
VANNVFLTVLWLLLLMGLLIWGSVASYLRLLMRRLTPLQSRRLFQFQEGAKIQADRERVGVSLSTLHGASMHLFAVFLAGFFFYHWPGEILENISASLAIVLAVIAIVDQLIPFRLVARHDEPEVILAKWLPFMRICVYLALPLTFPILVSTTIARLLEPMPDKDEGPSPHESLQELIEAGRQEGLIEKSEGDLIQSVMEFTDKTVREVMTPRPEIAALEINSPLENLRRLFREKRLTRYPVYSGQLDQIEGIVSVRDLMELPPEEQTKVTLRSLVRPVNFVPETKSIRDLLKELQQTITQMAIVIDEYGSVSGVVTVEDMVEEIVGEIRDEVEPHAADIVKETDSAWIVAGNTELGQIAGQLNVEFEPGDYSTVAGLMLSRLGHVPRAGEKVSLEGLVLEVLEASHRTVVKVRLQLVRGGAPTPHARNNP